MKLRKWKFLDSEIQACNHHSDKKKDCLSKAVLSRVLVPEAGIEPARPKWAQDFKSGASTYSATQALNPFYKKSRLSIGTLSGKRDSNSRPRPWQGRALPTELFPRFGFATAKVRTFFNLPKFFEEIFQKISHPAAKPTISLSQIP